MSLPARLLPQAAVVDGVDDDFLSSFLAEASFGSPDRNATVPIGDAHRNASVPSFPIDIPIDIQIDPIDLPIGEQRVLDLGISASACDFLFFRTFDFSGVVTTHVECHPLGSLNGVLSSFAHGGPAYGVQSAGMRYNFDNEHMPWFESLRTIFRRYCIQFIGDLQGTIQKGQMEQEHVFTFPQKNSEDLNFFTVPVNHKLNIKECLTDVAMGE